MTELRHEQVAVDGASIHAVTAGPADAPALLLLHGQRLVELVALIQLVPAQP